jgi:hypothetical protein
LKNRDRCVIRNGRFLSLPTMPLVDVFQPLAGIDEIARRTIAVTETRG